MNGFAESLIATTGLVDRPNVYGSSFDSTTRKIDGNGEQIWSVAASRQALAVDPDGFVYDRVGTEVVKRDPDGNVIWNVATAALGFEEVAVDEDFVYVVINNDTVRKLNKNTGATVTNRTISVGLNWNSVDADDEDHIYTGDANRFVRKLRKSDLGQVWGVQHTGTGAVFVVRVNRNKDFVWCAEISMNRVVKRSTVNGAAAWTFTGHTEIVRALTVDGNDFAYSGGNDQTVRKIDPSGTQVWSVNLGANVWATEVDAQGFVYAGLENSNLVKLDNDGNIVWTFTGFGNRVERLAADPGREGAFGDFR